MAYRLASRHRRVDCRTNTSSFARATAWAFGLGVLTAVFLFPGGDTAQAAESLDKCQKAVGKETGAYARVLGETVGRCLREASADQLFDGADGDDARRACVSRLSKLRSSDSPQKSPAARFEAKLDKACDPTVNDSLDHTEAEIYEIGEGALGARNLDEFCAGLGGDGSIDGFAEWRDCARSAAECQAYQSVAVEYPRALEHIEALRADIAAGAASTDELDALAVLEELDDAIEGPTDDNRPEIFCVGGDACLGTCGNDIAEKGEMCDGSDFDGATCSSLGLFAGTLTCTPDCRLDASGCTGGGLPGTEQTANLGPHSDGAIRAGRARSYTDNGDGTITDNVTGLTWEKKDDSGGIHDKDNQYTWCENTAPMYGGCDDTQYLMNGTVTTAFLDVLNDVAGGGADCFAHHCDWRLPNHKEFTTIMSHRGAEPMIAGAFHEPATCGGCTDVTSVGCSCSAESYWTSTSSMDALPEFAIYAHHADLRFGIVETRVKGAPAGARAVRGGL